MLGSEQEGSAEVKEFNRRTEEIRKERGMIERGVPDLVKVTTEGAVGLHCSTLSFFFFLTFLFFQFFLMLSLSFPFFVSQSLYPGEAVRGMER